jgi:hypothetical protein
MRTEITYYQSKTSLRETVEHFSGLNTTKSMHLGLFFLFKYLGISKTETIDGEIIRESGNLGLDLLGGLGDPQEVIGLRGCLFPFGIKPTIMKSDYYNGGTQLSRIYGRVKDTIDNSLIDLYLKVIRDEGKPVKYVFKFNYIEIVQSILPLTGKITIDHFARWIYRFVSIVLPEEEYKRYSEDPKLVTKVLIKKFLADFNITKEEEDAFFLHKDHPTELSKDKFSGGDLRALLSFQDAPEVKNTLAVVPRALVKTDIIYSDEVKTMSESTGDNISTKELLDLLLWKKQVILAGPPGTGKTFTAKVLESEFDHSEIHQLHPSTDYESFIGGYKYNAVKDTFIPQAGFFTEACEYARTKPQENHLLILDEINRTNLSNVLGETILVLERDYESSLSNTLDTVGGSKVSKLSIPENLYIIGTMNSADRSIALMDYAIRRRFAFVNFAPNYEILEDLSEYGPDFEINISTLLKKINFRLYTELKNIHLLIGHTYFIPPDYTGGKIQWTKESLKLIFHYTIIPLLEEYTYGNDSQLHAILGDQLPNPRMEADELIAELLHQFPDAKT